MIIFPHLDSNSSSRDSGWNKSFAFTCFPFIHPSKPQVSLKLPRFPFSVKIFSCSYRLMTHNDKFSVSSFVSVPWKIQFWWFIQKSMQKLRFFWRTFSIKVLIITIFPRLFHNHISIIFILSQGWLSHFHQTRLFSICPWNMALVVNRIWK